MDFACLNDWLLLAGALLSGGAARVHLDDVKSWFLTQLVEERGGTVLSPLSQEMAVFKSISRASCKSLTSCPCTNPGSQQSVIHKYQDSRLMQGEMWLDPRMESRLCYNRPLYISCGGLWYELVIVWG